MNTNSLFTFRVTTDRQTDTQTDRWRVAVTNSDVTLNLNTCERRTLATRQAEGRVAAGKHSRHLVYDVTVQTGVGVEPAGSHDMFLDAWDELLGVGVQTAVNLVERRRVRSTGVCVCVCTCFTYHVGTWYFISHCEDAPSSWASMCSLF